MPNPKSKFPSTTTVLGAYAGFDAVRPDRLELACRRGTAVHTACLAHAGNSFFFDIKPELEGYYVSFVRWFDELVDTVIEVEPLWEDHKWGYCGSPDLLLILKGEQDISIWDLKTSKSSGKTWACQLAGYRNLALANGYDRIGRVGSLRLKIDGGMPLADTYDYSDRDFSAFTAALTAYRYFHG